MPTELETLQEEIRQLETIKTELEALKNAKLQKLRLQVGNIPTQFQAQHPIISEVAKGIGQAIKGTATEAGKVAVEAGKETGRGLQTMAGGIGNYLEWAKANPGKGWASYIAEKQKMKQQQPQQPKQVRV